MITELIGTPSDDLINLIEDENCKNFIINLPKRTGSNFNKLFKNWKNADALDLLKKILIFDPLKRITIE